MVLAVGLRERSKSAPVYVGTHMPTKDAIVFAGLAFVLITLYGFFQIRGSLRELRLKGRKFQFKISDIYKTIFFVMPMLWCLAVIIRTDSHPMGSFLLYAIWTIEFVGLIAGLINALLRQSLADSPDAPELQGAFLGYSGMGLLTGFLTLVISGLILASLKSLGVL
jgi:hypothetical protein